MHNHTRFNEGPDWETDDEKPSSVPLSANVWMLLSSLVILMGRRRRI